MKLEMGCGHRFVEEPGVIGLDITPPAHVLADITAPALPFATGAFDWVSAEQVCEHVRAEHVFPLFEEVHRVLAPGGRFTGTVPGVDLDYRMAFRDPTHVSFWVRDSFAYLFGPLTDDLGREGRHSGRRATWKTELLIEDKLRGRPWAWLWDVRAVK